MPVLALFIKYVFYDLFTLIHIHVYILHAVLVYTGTVLEFLDGEYPAHKAVMLSRSVHDQIVVAQDDTAFFIFKIGYES